VRDRIAAAMLDELGRLDKDGAVGAAIGALAKKVVGSSAAKSVGQGLAYQAPYMAMSAMQSRQQQKTPKDTTGGVW